MIAISVRSSRPDFSNADGAFLLFVAGWGSVNSRRYEWKGSRLVSSFSTKSSSCRTLRRRAAIRFGASASLTVPAAPPAPEDGAAGAVPPPVGGARHTYGQAGAQRQQHQDPH